jgi:enamine deaminase RidA (YjgF/YER057c/UK114 family)
VIEHFERPAGLPPANGYSHAVIGTGRLVAVSGQLPLDEAGRLVAPDDALTQARRVFVNIASALAAAGAGPRDVLRLGFYLTDVADVTVVRVARDEFLDGCAPPASTLVQVGALVVDGARVEIDAIAIVG